MNLFIDIETIPDQREGAYQAILESVEPPGQYKKPESIQKWKDDHGEQVAKEVYHKTGLHGICGEICSIAWAVDDGPIFAFGREGDMKTESKMLAEFFIEITQGASKKDNDGLTRMQNITWIGHNVIDFDLRFLKQRCLINGIRPTFDIPADSRHGDRAFDTMKEWAGFRGHVSQDALAKAFGIEGKGDMDGSMVWDAYQAGEFEKIRDYNIDDVRTVREIYNRMVWK